MGLGRYLPVSDLRGYSFAGASKDLTSAVTMIFMAVPQGVAYALIAGLPPAMGLYAATFPAIVGSIFRSSRHVVVGPTNAISLLVGGALAAGLDVDPVAAGVTLAVMVGVIQLGAGVLGLGALVDFISSPVVLGYITGAAILIGVGQLPNLTATEGARGTLVHRIGAWVGGLDEANLVAVAVGLGTALVIVVLRKVDRRLPGAIIAMGLATLVSYVLGLGEGGLMRVKDLSPVPVGLPPLSIPDLGLARALLPFAIAASVLSLVESSAVARAIAGKSGQRLDSAAEFAGQGLSNIVSGFCTGYPVSGSLSRSALNYRVGAASRLAGVYSGLMMIAVLLFLGPLVNETPIASLAGLLVIIAWDLVDRERIRATFRAGFADGITFLATLLGTWSLSLDKAIYLGVAISIVLLLRQARLLESKEVRVAEDGHLHEVGPWADDGGEEAVPSPVRIVQLEGRLFFGVEGELRSSLDDFTRDPSVRVLVVRLKRTQGMDITVANVFRELAEQLADQGRALVLAGVPKATYAVLERTGVVDTVGRSNVFPARARWFESLGAAVEHAQALAGADGPGVNADGARRPPVTS